MNGKQVTANSLLFTNLDSGINKHLLSYIEIIIIITIDCISLIAQLAEIMWKKSKSIREDSEKTLYFRHTHTMKI